MGLVHGKDAANRHEGAFTELTSADILDKPVGFQAFAGKVCVVTNVASE
jgi:glutathione peroxidase-family protein